MKRSEADVLRSVRALLKARSLLHFRMNTGAMQNPRGQHVKFGYPGMADILCFPRGKVLWIETKAPGKPLSKAQVEFCKLVVDEGHHYTRAQSAFDVASWLSENQT